MNERNDKIERIWRELNKLPASETIELSPYEFKAKRKYKQIFTTG